MELFNEVSASGRWTSHYIGNELARVWTIADSEFRGPQFAPESGYISETNWYVGGDTTTDQYGRVTYRNYRDDMSQSMQLARNWHFRIRTVTNSLGQAISGYYGKMEGIALGGSSPSEWSICGTYYVNGAQNERAVEEMRGRDLNKNIFLRYPHTDPGGYTLDGARIRGYRWIGPPEATNSATQVTSPWSDEVILSWKVLRVDYASM